MKAVALAAFVMMAAPAIGDDEFDIVGDIFLPLAAPETIIIAGEITAATPLDFKRALLLRPNASTVELASDGGSIYGALVIAMEIHERGLNTHVPADFGCYSACAFLFFAGASREVDGELGVHQVYADASFGAAEAQLTVADIMDTLSTFDVAPGVLMTMLRTPPESMHVFSEVEIAALGIERIGVTSAAPPPVEAEAPVPDTIVPQTTQAADAALGRVERILTINERTPLDEVMRRNGFTDAMIAAIDTTLANVFPSTELPVGARVRILFGPSRSSNTLIPYRLSIYLRHDENGLVVHRATVALDDHGRYILGLPPAPIEGEHAGPPAAPLPMQQDGKQPRARTAAQ